MPSPALRRSLAASALVLAILGTPAALARRPGDRTEVAAELWAVGHPILIAVTEGSARFVVPSPSQTSRTLLVVSALTPTPGTYPIRISAGPSAEGPLPKTAPSLPAKAPIRAVPAPESTVAPARSDPPPERTFHLQDRDGDPSSPANYRPVAAMLRSFGRDVQVYVDREDLERVSSETLQDIALTFEEKILPLARSQIGAASDIDGDGRFCVLVSGKLDGLAGGRLAVDGFVRGADFDPAMAPPLGNRCDMLCLNASLAAGPHLRTVLAHEYTHAAVYCRKVLDAKGPDEEGWLDEALAHLGEDLHGFSRTNIDHRTAAFLAAPERYRLLVADYDAAGLIRSHGHRGCTYLFLKWCVQQNGPGLFGTLARSPLRGVANLEAATSTAFADLFRGWSTALFLDSLAPGNGDGHDAGPRFARVIPGGEDDRWTADGTTTHFAIVEPSPTGFVAIEVHGPSDAQVQVTAIRLPDTLPRIDLAATIEADDGGELALRATIRERDGRRVQIQSLSWEVIASIPVAIRSQADARRSLAGEDLRVALGGDVLRPRGKLASKPIRLENIRPGDGSLVVRMVATDDEGRRISAWAEVETGRIRQHQGLFP